MTQLKNLENQFSQRWEDYKHKGLANCHPKLVNPKQNVSVICLRSGRKLEETPQPHKDLSFEKDMATTSREEIPPPKLIPKPSIPTNISSLNFPSRFANLKKEESKK